MTIFSLTRPCIPVTQPIGTFYLTSLPASELTKRVSVFPRRESSPDHTGVQRELSVKRRKEIAQYVSDPDATFPTPIIISCSSNQVSLNEDLNEITFTANEEDGGTLGEVLDGQHRLEGLKNADPTEVSLSKFFLPVVVMLDQDPSERAYVFSIINSKQTPVAKSLIYDLFGLSSARTPYLTCHQIARALNTMPESPFYRGLKMIGKKKLPTELLTQGSFVKYLLLMITKKPDAVSIAMKLGKTVPPEPGAPFNQFFIDDRDDLILTTLINYFTAIKDIFPDQWDFRHYQPQSEKTEVPSSTPVFRRTVGFEALMKVLERMWTEIQETKDISASQFNTLATKLRTNVGDQPITTKEFSSSSGDASRLVNILLGEN
jgi:DGQHR domain-containing protein